MEIRVLGPTRAISDGAELDLGGRRPADVLALLAAAEGEAVPAEVLAERLWRGRPPATALTTLQGYVARLRRLLEPGRPARDAAILVTRGNGYALELPRDAVDAHRFADLVGRARDAASAAERAELLAGALEAFRGRPYDDVADVVDVQPARVRLEELRLAAVEELAEARLTQGRGPELVADLVAVAAQNPLRERAQALLARAMYQAGRQAEALEVLRRARELLAGELGLDPAPELRRLEAAMLRQDAGLAAPPAPAVSAASSAPTASAAASSAPTASAAAPSSPVFAAAPPPPIASPPSLRPTAGLGAPAVEADGFVGRRVELAALEEAWASAGAGRTTAVVVTGEPGIGKTRLVEAFAGRAGATARWGRCSPIGGAPPYWPWQQILGGLPDAAAGGDAGARFALGLEVTRWLRALAADRPVLIVLDDVQWADPDSVHVLEIVLSELRDARAAIAVTCREEAAAEPGPARILALAARLPGARRLALTGLTRDEVGALATGLRGHDPGPDAARSLAERSGGNPFFVTELAVLTAPAAGDAVPAGVRDVLRLRLAALPEEAADLVGAVAVAGRDVAVAIVAAALDRPGAAASSAVRSDVDAAGRSGLDAAGLPASRSGPDAAISPALRSGLLAEPAPGRLRVRHDLVREVVLAELGPARRAALHGRLADALEAAAAAATSAAAIAVHRSEAAAGAPDPAAARACLRASREALDRAGDGEAAELAARGLAHVPAGEEDLLADLQHVRGAALRRLGLLEESAAALRAEAEVARRRGDDDRLARAALASAGGGVGGYWASVGAPAATDVRLLEDAAARAERLEPTLRSQVLAARAVQRASTGHDDGPALAEAASATVDEAASAVADEAADSPTAAQAPADAAGALVAARARAAVAGFVARWTPDRAAGRVDLARAMLRAAADHPAYEATALHLLRCALMGTVQAEECDAVSRRYTRLASRRGDGDLLLLDSWWHAGLALARGDYAEARRIADEAVTAAPTVSPAAAEVTRMSRQTVEGIIAWHEHRLPEVVSEVVDLAATVDPDWLGVLAQAHAQAGRREVAYAAIDRLRAYPGAGVREPVRTILLADVYLELGDAERAAALLPALRAYGDTVIVLWAGTTMLGPASLYRGGVLALLGDPAAGAELDRAAEICDLFGFAPFAKRVEKLR
ncbi:BTAD domain-containing putative transcriptional regulator [Actinoplanes sp. CA-030573]|uniref:BTAD domain-containing putative transcriptional regulator n=1 Tax=Actinoplanes sp. CA-030573 TaxID=3239898 RepID=UPI003D8B87D6